MNKKTIWGIVITLVVVIGAATVYMVAQRAGAPSNPTTSNTNTKNAAATITYSSSGFSPSTTTVKSGDVVAIKNTSSDELQLDSDPHPVHTDDTELNVGTVNAGQTVTFTVTTKGTHGFHNHLNPGNTGTLIVQ